MTIFVHRAVANRFIVSTKCEDVYLRDKTAVIDLKSFA